MYLPSDVEYILEVLYLNGYQAYCVGGCVRDSLMGIKPHDYDICTSATPDQILGIFNECGLRCLTVGLKHGTVTVILGSEQYEITTFRIDGDYSDGRHPDEVIFTDKLYEDLARRDFTMNAIAYNFRDGIVDPFHGQDDIKRRIIRCVGDANERFQEDALRMLRCLRFASRFNDLYIDGDTRQALITNAHLLKNASVERIQSELVQILECDNHSNQILYENLIYLLSVVVPELEMDDKYDIARHLIGQHSTGRNVYTMAALLFDFCEETLDDVLRRLRFPNDDIYHIKHISANGYDIVENLDILMSGNVDLDIFARDIISRIGYGDAFESVNYAISYQSVDMDKVSFLFGLKEIVGAHYVDEGRITISSLEINGNDLLALGYQDRKIGEMLNILLDKVIHYELGNKRDQLMWFVKNYKAKQTKS